MDEINKSEGNAPHPVVAATFTHSILIESMLFLQFKLLLHLIVVCVDIIKEPVLTDEHDDEKQLLTKTEKDGQYGSGYLPGLSWVLTKVIIISEFSPCIALA